VVALDQATKVWATRALAGEPPVEILPHLFHFTYHRNTGGIFGFLAGPASMSRRLFFIGATLLALIFLFSLLRTWGRESRLAFFGLALVAGGAVGNVIDRVVYGEVIDFIDWHWYRYHWPTFNIADSAITTGVLLLLMHAIFTRSPEPRE
jgi:signal peptidase II